MARETAAHRRVMITGAQGFVARHLLAALAHAGVAAREIAAFAFPADGLSNLPALDVTQRQAVAEAMAALRPTAVVHLAAVAAPADAKADPRRAWEVNVVGTHNVADAILCHAPDAVLVFPGSAHAYGASFERANAPLTEDAPLRPVTVYGETKAAGDVLIGQLCRDGLRAVRFRAVNHTGPGQSPRYAAAAFASQIARIERGLQAPVIEVGNLETERDMLDVRDVVRAYADVAVAPERVERNAIFNLASGRPRRMGALLEAMLTLTPAAVEVRVNPGRVRENEIPRIACDFSRAKDALGWSPSIPLEATLKDVLQHCRSAL